MHSHVQAVDTDIGTTARKWLARLHAPDCSDAERSAFQRWYEADPNHAAAYDELFDIWQRSSTLRRHDEAFAAALQEARRPARRRRLGEWMPHLAAAAVVVVMIAGLFRYFAPGDVPPVRYATRVGEQRIVALEDGSQLVLDTGTEVDVQYGRQERRLTLVHGQAEFQVRHDSDRPFVVYTEGGTVTATGTRFQVRDERGLSEVTLLEGQVIVAATPKPGGTGAAATLAPGERIAFEPAGGLGPRRALAESDLARLRGWTGGQLVVRDWPLVKVLAELNRYSGIQLELDDPALRDLPISGRFKTTDPQTFAQSLEYGWPISAEQASADRIVLKRK